MKIAIIGTGGVGGYFGAKLALAGNDVAFLARGKHYDALKQYGIKVKSIHGDFEVSKVKVVNSIEQLGVSDLVILGVKAWQVKGLAPQIKQLIHDKTIVLPLQNGVVAFDELNEHIDEKHLVGGLCRIISLISSPGVISHIGVTPTIIFGRYDKQVTPELNHLEEVIRAAGIQSQLSEDIEAALWRKFIAICVSGLLAVTKTTYGEIRELQETRTMMRNLLTEIYDLADAKNIQIEADYVEKTMSFFDSFPYDTTSSLTRDVLDGKPSEIEYQNGTVVKLAKEVGVNVPVNSFVYNCILPMERKARKMTR